MEVAMPSGFSKRFLLVLNLLAASALLIGAVGCADSLVYAKDARSSGLALYNQGEYGDAAACFANATRQDPRDYRSYYYLGATYDAMHSYQQAIGAYHSCLDVMPLTLEGDNNVSFRLRAIDSLATSIAHSESHASRPSPWSRSAPATHRLKINGFWPRCTVTRAMPTPPSMRITKLC
jgi:tetratricopeptide (TPR) repeat protein